MACCVYKHMDESGEVLYIGVSKDPLSRTLNHEKTAAWFPLVRNIEVLHFPTREVALQQEALLVAKLKPRFNVDHLLDRALDSRERRRLLVGERHMKLRPLIQAELTRQSEGDLSRKIGTNSGTLIRFAYSDVVPHVETVEKIEAFISQGKAGQ